MCVDAKRYKVTACGFDAADTKLIDRFCKALGWFCKILRPGFVLTHCVGIEYTTKATYGGLTHVICSPSYSEKKIGTIRAKGIPVVGQDWLLDHVSDNPPLLPSKLPSQSHYMREVTQGPLTNCVVAIRVKEAVCPWPI